MSAPSPWTSFYVAISIHECHLAPSLGLDQPISNPHLEHRVSPSRFHQLIKTKLGLSHGCPHGAGTTSTLISDIDDWCA
jgi:hypothetical protein